MTCKTEIDVRMQPSISHWTELATSPKGVLFGTSLEHWRTAARQTLGLPSQKPIVIVGHQPIFFHPGILAKFMAADHVVTQVNGVLVHIVVDHHQGNSGIIDVPTSNNTTRLVRQVCLATLDPHIAMKNQSRVECAENLEPFSSALDAAAGDNAALQFAHATDSLMSPWVTVHHVIGSSELLQTDLGKAILVEMMQDPQRCITAYNDAILQHPACGMAQLASGELPLWQGKYNSKVTSTCDDLRPRALLLTLLARLTIGDLFVHGVGGDHYDNVMESWLHAWLGVKPCQATMVTATLTLPPLVATSSEVRKKYFSPRSERKKKQSFLDAIAQAPYGSPLRLSHFQAMHKWLASIGTRPDAVQLRFWQHVANRRDWAFPLYPIEMLQQLHDSIMRS